MNDFAQGDSTKPHIEMLAAPRERRVIWCGEIAPGRLLSETSGGSVRVESHLHLVKVAGTLVAQ